MRKLMLIALLALYSVPVNAEILVDLPKHPDLQKVYVFYLHGKIVEGSDGRPVSPVFGPYEYKDILSALSSRGFTVISEIRPKGTDTDGYSQKIARWIQTLIKKGVPQNQISVVGASKGGVIAARVSSRLKHSEISYVILAGLFAGPSTIKLTGRVLSIHDSSDKFPLDPNAYFQNAPDVTESSIIIANTGLGHGLLYTPHKAWVNDTEKWIRPKKTKTDSAADKK